jgi:fused signal recognition particle receptor
MELVIFGIVVLAVLVGIVGFVVATRSRGVAELEPPEAPPREARPEEVAPPPAVDEVEAAVTEAPPGEAVTEQAPPVEAPVVPTRPRFRERLSKARGALSGAFASVLSRPKIDDEAWDELEEALIRADVGVETSIELIGHAKGVCAEQGINEPAGALEVLKAELTQRLASSAGRSLSLDAKPAVWLFVGVNGVGKTTTIGKLGKREVDEGRAVVFAAGDTFRAAAVEQLGMWAERVGAECVHGDEGADPSSVVFDAIESASARGADLVLADTAGRLHTKVNLMEELSKVRRVAEKGVGTVTEVLLVLDATTGQNGLTQARQFTEAVDLTGVVLTKLDGSAKGGIVLAIQSDLGLPVKLVGLGEGAEDLVEFDENEFVEALFD